ncbi:2-hydroxyacid dehydrogenase [Rhizobium leguminosarum]|uniref:2-hydroxyacid dehydrogenase n=1 Tax=Rhizobium leguminosarum TaxID=384 RepID=UPI00143FA517|nr:glyoxylate/hydroxypyruvate reductase A [Rhizobium leguminosarum]NKL21194.1 glyoxylate/hydroxypyruvate reductase A [Rhizobium leguminosarum bv. viciae]NKL56898.1 glyoxylate/hydroxypyruvate reductase A [Rhizobium leguminosarum bv. viciae]
MEKPVAFVTSLDRETESRWLTRIGKLLPTENLLPFREMNTLERKAADIAVVANPDPVDVRSLSGLVWIHSLWAGVERLVAVLGPSAPPIVRLVDPELARAMAEAVLAWTHYLQRDMPAYRRQQSKRLWRQQPYRHPSTVTVGVLGLGTLGTVAAQRLVGAGFAVTGWSRSPKFMDSVVCLHGEDGLNELLRIADITVCLLPLTSDTKDLLHAGRLTRMRAGASLINFARGPVVVTEDLVRALDAGQLSHAVLDVFEHEPLSGDSPLWDHPSITVLPHISAPTDMESAARIIAQNIGAYRSTGLLPRTIDVESGY